MPAPQGAHRAAGVLRVAAVLWLGSVPSLTGAAALLLNLAALLLVSGRSRLAKRLAHALEAAVDCLQPACACALFHALYPSAPGAGPLRALACVLAGNGVLAMAWRAKLSPLPFRWQAPVLAATAATLLAHTRSMCASGLLQHGYRTLNTFARIVLPLAAPGLLDLMPRGGLLSLAVPAPAPDAAGAAMCAAYQAPSVLLGAAALACHLYAAEVRARKAAGTPAAASGNAGSTC